MPKCKYKKAAIIAVSSIVPSYCKTLDEETELLGSSKNIEKLKKITGLCSRRIADNKTTTLDLCQIAAIKLFDSVNDNVQGIDGVVFVTQTPDYKIPNNASLIHGMLDLKQDCLCYDVNHGCSGYIYGLLNSFNLVESGMCRKVLLLTGDTITKTINPRDKSLSIIHGDAGSATLIEYTDKQNISDFIVYSNGKKAKTICIEAGGFRNATSNETAEEKMDGEGNVRSLEQLYMNGLEVFNFALHNVPPLVNEILEFSGKTADDIELFAFHQANGIINRGIVEKLSLPLEKAPMDVIREYGNPSCATIPLVLSKALGGKEKKHIPVVMAGFGVGLSWGACYTSLDQAAILPVIDYDPLAQPE